MLNKIKNLDPKGLEHEAEEVRRQIIDVCSKNGGHLASSLGTVDLTLALLNVFDLPHDKIVWDVGHQAYAYKILTDRKEDFHSLRTLNGISGFPKRSESPFDFFGMGHGGNSISAALGIKEAMKRKKEAGKVIAVIGDGAMTSGMSFEAMNQAEATGKDMITILNDNDMFIATSVGSLSSWFSRKLTGATYNTVKKEVKGLLSKLPPFFHGDKILDVLSKTLDSSKSLLTPGMLFEGFGYNYVGPIDGHNMEEMIETFRDIRDTDGPVLVHVVTKKGKGYPFAEENPTSFHGVSPFDKETGKPVKKSGPSFTGYLGSYLPALFRRNRKLVAITAAMPDGTGLVKLQNSMPDRVYDVGMAEGHAVTFAAGLAAGGLRPMVAIYSTFFQRAYDSIIHDVSLQNLPVTFLIDRAGIVGEDGATHHGIFDIAYMRNLPNMTVIAPRDELEMSRALEFAAESDSPVAIRYPRGSGTGRRFYNRVSPFKEVEGELLEEADSDILIVSVGITSRFAQEAAEILKERGKEASVYDLRFVKPLPEELFELIEKKKIRNIVTIEDGIVAGGAGSALIEELGNRGVFPRFSLLGIKDRYPTHGTQQEIRDMEGINSRSILDAVSRLVP